MPFTATQLENLARAIGDRFDFDAMGFLLFKCVGDNKIAEIAAPTAPTRQIAMACLQQAIMDGVEVPLLAFAINARKNDDVFRKEIQLIEPRVSEATPTTRDAVDTIVEALFEVRLLLETPAVREAAEISQASLRLVGSDILVLQVHKRLHDGLHQLQQRRYESLLEAADRVIAGGRQDVELLRDFQDRLLVTQQIMTDAVKALATGDTNRRAQEQWVVKLGKGAQMLQTALDAKDEPSIRMALGIVQRILENEPGQINNVIFATARTLPLSPLVETLEKIGAAAEPAVNDPAKRAGNLMRSTHQVRAVQMTLTARTAEHQLWQEADDRLWTLGRVFTLPPINMLRDFVKLWPLVQKEYQVLIDAERDEQWAKLVNEYATGIADQLAALEGKLAKNGVLQADDLALLQEFFGNFRSQVRLRFFRTDQSLKSECDTLVAIRPPIEKILDELVS